jgi:hypothetical protein
MLHTGIACAVLAASLASSLPAFATLGQGASSVSSDQAVMRAVAHSAASTTGYTVHTITLESGTQVREYVGTNGIVFGVAWEGPTLPDLKSTLGSAFDQYVAANATRRATPVAVSTSDLVVVSTGHLRAFSGYAYLPQAVPAGVDIAVIR